MTVDPQAVAWVVVGLTSGLLVGTVAHWLDRAVSIIRKGN